MQSDRLTLTERQYLLNRLGQLREQGQRPPESWRQEVSAVLGASPILKPLDGLLGAQKGDSPEETQNIKNIVTAAISTIGNERIGGLGADVEALIARNVDAAIWRSSPATVLKFLAPSILLVLMGGVGWGVWKIDGVLQQAENATLEMTASLSKVRQASEEAQKDIRSLRNGSVDEINRRIDAEAGKHLAALTDIFEVSKRRAKETAEQGVAELQKDLKQQEEKANLAYRTFSDSLTDILGSAPKKIDETRQGLVLVGAEVASLGAQVSKERKVVENQISEIKLGVGANYESDFRRQVLDGEAIYKEKMASILRDFDGNISDLQRSTLAAMEPLLKARSDISTETINGYSSAAEIRYSTFADKIEHLLGDAPSETARIRKEVEEIAARQKSLEGLADKAPEINAVIARLEARAPGFPLAQTLGMLTALDWTALALAAMALLISCIALFTTRGRRGAAPASPEPSAG